MSEHNRDECIRAMQSEINERRASESRLAAQLLREREAAKAAIDAARHDADELVAVILCLLDASGRDYAVIDRGTVERVTALVASGDAEIEVSENISGQYILRVPAVSALLAQLSGAVRGRKIGA
ncbi:MAG: hypothetical protein IJ381_08385 [Clostridia bacterium]|nr:hypothetical protein [Clostridia bacterium]MBQ7982638.1 hypothetical protein [Clostridia bacterium]